MIRQFLANTVENLRSFWASLAPGSGRSREPEARPAPDIELQRRRLRAAGLLSGPVEPRTPKPPNDPPNVSAPSKAPSEPPAPDAEESGVPNPGLSLPVARHSHPDGLVKPQAQPPERQPEQLPQPDRQPPPRASRAPQLFPTQAVPLQPARPEIDDVSPPTAPDAPPDESTEDPGPPPQFGGDAEGAFSDVQAVLESLLFVAGEAVEAAQLARVLEMEEDEVVAAMRELAAAYTRHNRGLRLQAHRNRYQLVSAPMAAHRIERFLNLDSGSKLSGPALETLAVVAYRQPVTRSQVEAVRGVDCAAVLRSLVQRGLIEEVGRMEVVGRPILYGVSDLFLQHFGLTDLSELPPLEQVEADTLWAATTLAELEGQAAGESLAASPPVGAASPQSGSGAAQDRSA